MREVKLHVISVGALVSALPYNGHAIEAASLQPTSAWAVNYADNSCQLIRKFGSGADERTLFLTRTAPGGDLGVQLVGGEKMGKSGDTITVTWDGQPAAERRALLGTVGSPPQNVVRAGRVPVAEPADGAAENFDEIAAADGVKSFAVTFKDETSVVLNTGPMGAPMRAMRTCMDDLLKGWDLDPQAVRSLQSQPIWENEQSLIVEMLRQKPADEVDTFFLTIQARIDAEGGISHCTAEYSYGNATFEQKICDRFAANAQITPAIGPSGETVATLFEFREGISVIVRSQTLSF